MSARLRPVGWNDSSATLFSTPSGSRLYGMAHAHSDFDTYEVLGGARRRVKHSIVGSEDVTQLSFASFMAHASSGTPQALEAMFSPIATVDNFPELRADFYADGVEITDRYIKTAKKFALETNFKARRHALRLLLNLRDLRLYNRFNPRLSERQIKLISAVAHEGELPGARYLELFRELAPYEIIFRDERLNS